MSTRLVDGSFNTSGWEVLAFRIGVVDSKVLMPDFAPWDDAKIRVRWRRMAGWLGP